jgi:hypothetical protein
VAHAFLIVDMGSPTVGWHEECQHMSLISGSVHTLSAEGVSTVGAYQRCVECQPGEASPETPRDGVY